MARKRSRKASPSNGLVSSTLTPSAMENVIIVNQEKFEELKENLKKMELENFMFWLILIEL